MYGRHFESLYEGSLIGKGAVVFAVWGYVISKRRRSYVELNPELLGFVLGEGVEEIRVAIEFLCSPDPRSRSKDEEGRRLVKDGEFLYRVVNAEKYDQIATEEERRLADRLRKRETRQAANNGELGLEVGVKGCRFKAPGLEEMKLAGVKMGLPEAEAERCWHYYESNGWRVGKNPMKSWAAAMVNWRKNWQERTYESRNASKTGERVNPRLVGVSRSPVNDYGAIARRKMERQVVGTGDSAAPEAAGTGA